MILTEEMIDAFLDVWCGSPAWRGFAEITKRAFRDKARPALQAALNAAHSSQQ